MWGVVMVVHLFDQIRNLGHGHAFLEHVNDKGLQRIVRVLVRSDGLLVEFAVPVTWNRQIQISVIRMKCPRIDTVSGVVRIKAKTAIFLVIQKSRQFGLKERMDRFCGKLRRGLPFLFIHLHKIFYALGIFNKKITRCLKRQSG